MTMTGEFSDRALSEQEASSAAPCGGETSAQDLTPKDPAPRDSAPKDSAPKDSATRDSSIGDPAMGDSSMENPSMEDPAQTEPGAFVTLLHEKIVARLRTVYDPEIPVNLYDLGLIYRIALDPVDMLDPIDMLDPVDTRDPVDPKAPPAPLDPPSPAAQAPQQFQAVVDMTLTSVGCPLADQMPGMVRHVLQDLPELANIEVRLVWDPPWTPARMSDEARLALNLF